LVSFYAIKDNAGKKSCSVTDMRVGAMPLLDHPLYNLLPRPIRRDVWDKTIEKLIGFCSDQSLIPIIRDFETNYMLLIASILLPPVCTMPFPAD
jgi:hypothetical protein